MILDAFTFGYNEKDLVYDKISIKMDFILDNYVFSYTGIIKIDKPVQYTNYKKEFDQWWDARQ